MYKILIPLTLLILSGCATSGAPGGVHVTQTQTEQRAVIFDGPTGIGYHRVVSCRTTTKGAIFNDNNRNRCMFEVTAPASFAGKTATLTVNEYFTWQGGSYKPNTGSGTQYRRLNIPGASTKCDRNNGGLIGAMIAGCEKTWWLKTATTTKTEYLVGQGTVTQLRWVDDIREDVGDMLLTYKIATILPQTRVTVEKRGTNSWWNLYAADDWVDRVYITSLHEDDAVQLRELAVKGQTTITRMKKIGCSSNTIKKHLGRLNSSSGDGVSFTAICLNSTTSILISFMGRHQVHHVSEWTQPRVLIDIADEVIAKL